MAAGGHWWVSQRDALQDQGYEIGLEYVRVWSKIGGDISLLRALDISIWMAHSAAPT